jgi:hypothetical protein
MTLKEESVIEMIAYKRPRRIFVAIFHDSYNSENELSHCLYKEMLLKREIRKKEKNI